MLSLKDLSHIGFGSYRVSVKSEKHYDALKLALTEGCSLIDTSANYTDGDSELLIGKVLIENPKLKAFIISKVGYIQGQNLRLVSELQKRDRLQEGIISISEDLSHSIHPDFIRVQLDKTLHNLQVETLDCYLLHNPEYFFDDPKLDEIYPTLEKKRGAYYQNIELALTCLNQLVQEGKIRYFGISSNTFAYKPDNPRATDLGTILEILKKIGATESFKFIQFPYNFIEDQATQKHFNGKSLLEMAKENKLITLVNRPLNAFQDSGLLRLAHYKTQELGASDLNDIFDICFQQLEVKWEAQGEERGKLHDLPLIKQFKEIWNTLPTPDAVDQVFQLHFFPFLAQVWGGVGLTPDEAKPFYLLYDTAIQLALEKMNEKAKDFQQELIEKGVLANDNCSFSQQVVNHYLSLGFNHILVGMRKEQYVRDLKCLF